MSPADLVQLAGPISSENGPGLFLRIILIASFVGVGLMVWALARAGRDGAKRDAQREAEREQARVEAGDRG
ncbi:hypothetical protein [Kitasatospora cheerisanensis]|uniref:Uncharacterized protein n=1 Tax=Kitasatospora cheerisanensis KCTC 2395 TaxID=1348663 RepID=A0A066YW78_9ACTN|nr:hypothetical protein [Kitasatospora cheerisanensis]KDN85507.1 hypothetical protein KCH_27380 [Kitasatospora cheerisanensis KCTC 2395]